jgi:hypothetical protein
MPRLIKDGNASSIAAFILAARKLAQYDGGRKVPATVSAISDALRWAEKIMREIDRRWPNAKNCCLKPYWGPTG